MTYTEEVVVKLFTTLEKLSRLDVSHLAGHVPNLDFWADEVLHGRSLLAKYEGRFQRQKQGQRDFQATKGPHALQVYESKSDLSGPVIKRGLKHSRCRERDQQLVAAFRRLVQRCAKENLISEQAAESLIQGGFQDREH